MTGKSRFVYGVGINDADYAISAYEDLPKVNGKRRRKRIWYCPFYIKWSSMLQRCYDAAFIQDHPHYLGCSVCEEWFYFSKFKSWMIQQDWEGKDLDKDLVLRGNKTYSPETCLFVSKQVNGFLSECTATRGNHPIGVTFDKKLEKYKAQGRNGGSVIYLGTFETSEEAHDTYRKFKALAARKLALIQTDERVADALLKRYPYPDIECEGLSRITERDVVDRVSYK